MNESGHTYSNETDAHELLGRHRRVSVNKWDAPSGGDKAVTIVEAERDMVRLSTGQECIDWNGGILCGILCGILDPKGQDIQRAIQDQIMTGVLHTSSVALNPAVLAFKEAAAESLKQWGDFVILPASSGTIADSMALRIALANLLEHQILKYVIPHMGYNGADFRGNAMCGQDIWKGKSTPKEMTGSVHYIPPSFEDLPPFDASKQIPATNINDWFDAKVGKRDSEYTPITLAEAGELGSGGFRRIPSEWMRELTYVTKQRGGIFICDCVQTFPGRTGEGNYWGFERWIEKKEDVPDIITTAKGLGNGMPIALIAVRRDLAEQVDGKWFDTYGGNPIADRVATVVMQKTQTPEIRYNMEQRAAQLRESLIGMANHPFNSRIIRKVVGAGLMSGLAVDPAKAEIIRQIAQNKGLWIALGIDGTLRIAPHFDTTAKVMDDGIGILWEALNDARNV